MQRLQRSADTYQILGHSECTGLYGVAQPPRIGNCSPEVVNARSSQDKPNPINALDCLVDDGKLDDVEVVLDFLPSEDYSKCATHQAA
ncbi:hypothetical protein HPB50_018744 [Hyalomma asiaticum]|uniref:Uncharacterized protein n=1 Tax=Hyalomma asiaticum TaxID=266040 RepID=A0ACB7TAZ6_HYAAI|nr:hypothetical protein HPB50_018744 [Hyalomma asiaticum]